MSLSTGYIIFDVGYSETFEQQTPMSQQESAHYENVLTIP